MSPEIFPVTPLVSDAEVVPSSDSGSPMELSIEVTEVSVVAVGVALELPSGVPSVGAAVSTPVISLPEWSGLGSGSTHPVVTVAAKPVSSPVIPTSPEILPVLAPTPLADQFSPRVMDRQDSSSPCPQGSVLAILGSNKAFGQSLGG